MAVRKHWRCGMAWRMVYSVLRRSGGMADAAVSNTAPARGVGSTPTFGTTSFHRIIETGQPDEGSHGTHAITTHEGSSLETRSFFCILPGTDVT